MLRLLARAARVLGTDLHAHPCAYGHYFETRDPQCVSCTYEPECRFVTEGENPNRTTAELLDALEYAATQLEGLHARANHDREHCACATCGWLREAWLLTRAGRATLGA